MFEKMYEVVTEKVHFPGSIGQMLTAKLDRPKNDAWAYGVYSPCFTCTKDILVASRICNALAGHGIGMLRVDFTGQGESDGDFVDTTFTTNVDDLLCAIDYMDTQGQRPYFLIGHSLGGTAALVASSKSDFIRAAVTINSPSNPRHVARHFRQQQEDIINDGYATVQVSGRDYKISKKFIDSLEKYDMNSILAGVNCALLIAHSPQDSDVMINNASELFTMAHHPKSFLSLESMDHLISKKVDSQYIGDVVSAWIQRYKPQV
jgi:alpha/beta superfamily hydrolase